MSERTTMFSGLFKKDSENSVTEVFVNLLRYKYLRDFILNFLLEEYLSKNEKKYDFCTALENLSINDISTQRHFPGYGESGEAAVPDIVIETNDVFILLENKIKSYTEIQPAQLDGYIRLIADKGKAKNSAYIFLLPDGYAEENKIEEKIRGKNNVFIKKWSTLLQEMYKNDLVENNPIVSEAVKYFLENINLDNFHMPSNKSKYEIAWDYTDENISKYKDINKSIDEIYAKITELCETVVSSLQKDGHDFKQDKLDKKNPYQFTSYIGYKKSSSARYSYNLGICCTFENDSALIQLCIKENAISANSNSNTVTKEIIKDWGYFLLYKYTRNDNIEKKANDCVGMIK